MPEDPAVKARLLRPNTERLGSVLRGDERSNRRMDERERRGAEDRLRRMDGDGGKYGPAGGGGGGGEREREAGHRRLRDGAIVRDGYSKGLVADRAIERKKPYQCDLCERSYAIAPDLSDHLKQAHNVHRHPSQIVPTAVIL